MELVPRSPAWQEAVSQLFSRQGYTGKEADVKWRVVLPSGDRIGAFSGQQMSDWVLRVSVMAPTCSNCQRRGGTGTGREEARQLLVPFHATALQVWA